MTTTATDLRSLLAGRTVALAVTGSIAAYKAVEIARLCVKAGATVLPLMTPSATRFLGAVTLSGITGEPVAREMWDAAYPGEKHVAIAARADALVIAPATADVLSRLAHGRADDLVTAVALCARGPVLVAPAMHPRMWLHPATKHNVEALAQQGRVTLVGPVFGEVASGETGLGRMSEPEAIVQALCAKLEASGKQDLAEKHVVVTAGPTHEAVDPVRYLGNRSSGRMGFAIAAAAAARGAEVTLIAGPVSLPSPPGLRRRIDISSAAQMKAALEAALGPDLLSADALIMAAAVADFRPRTASATKLKKTDGAAATVIELEKNEDLLASIGARRNERNTPVLVGFALETGGDAEVLAYACAKLISKRVDLIVANAARDALGCETNRIALVTHHESTPSTTALERAAAGDVTRFIEGTKEALAHHVLDCVAARLP